MISFNDLPADKEVFIFELDDVLIPKKDYDLQVYYLFANFLVYLEVNFVADEIVNFIKKRYETFGNENMFSQLQMKFTIDSKYEENLSVLFECAKLPLKLLLYKEMLTLLQELVVNRKKILLLTAGNVKQQLNKIKQTEWNGLDKFMKVYFSDEFDKKPAIDALDFIINENKFKPSDLVVIGNKTEAKMAKDRGIEFIQI